ARREVVRRQREQSREQRQAESEEREEERGRGAVVVMQSMRGRVEEEVEDEAVMAAAVGEMYVNGVDVEWEQYYEGERRMRVGLPTYQFERERYWVEAMRRAVVVESREGAEEEEEGKRVTKRNEGEAKKADLAQWFYVPYWKPSVLDSQKGMLLKPEGGRRWLVFVDESGIGELVVERLKDYEQEVVSVKIGERFAEAGEGVYTIDPARRDDYTELLKELARQNRVPEKIVHLWSVTSEEEESTEAFAGRAQERGFYSLLHLAQALGQSVAASLEMLVVSNNMQAVTGMEAQRPEKATVLGPCKVISQEFVNIRCRSIDLNREASGSWQAGRQIEQLMSEISMDGAEVADSIVALRRGQRWAQGFEAVRLEESVDGGQAGLREEGVYLITGGLGGIGLALAEHLARVARAKLVLVGRAGLPEREQWDELVASDETQNSIAGKIKRVRALEALGAEVLVLSADVSDETRMREVLAETRGRFGALHGVIHAAGVPGAGIIQLKTQQVAAGVLAPKVQGTLVLESILKDTPLDFLVLFSTISSITGEAGQVDYCAANAFLDAFAHYHAAKTGTNTVSVNWGQWQWDDWEATLMAFLPKAQARLKKSREKFGMTFAEGIEALNRVLSARLPQVVVSPQDFDAILEQGRANTAAKFLQEAEKVSLPESSHSRPLTGTDYVAPGSELERRITEIWQSVFGINQIGVHDSFFDLGGHSLLAIQLISRLRETFRLELPLGSFFETPTISGVAKIIEDQQPEDEGLDDLDEILKEIESLSLDEARTQLAQESQTGSKEGMNG
ncbi:MAG: SDR family oxidoreductase, partial [Pyrinomonadaceae bacterium]